MGAEGHTIALVDDDASVRRALQRLLRSHAYRSEAFSSGAEFLSSSAEKRSACVIMDQQMPDLEGLEVLAEMRKRGSDVPVILITGFDRPGLRERCLEAGAADYLVKPISGAIVLAAVEAATKETEKGTGK
jgi:two-component system, LuxR family, response regulator FixJ